MQCEFIHTAFLFNFIYKLFHFKKSKKQRIAQNQPKLGEEPFSG
jgi:hypothetical protein